MRILRTSIIPIVIHIAFLSLAHADHFLMDIEIVRVSSPIRKILEKKQESHLENILYIAIRKKQGLMYGISRNLKARLISRLSYESLTRDTTKALFEYIDNHGGIESIKQEMQHNLEHHAITASNMKKLLFFARYHTLPTRHPFHSSLNNIKTILTKNTHRDTKWILECPEICSSKTDQPSFFLFLKYNAIKINTNENIATQPVYSLAYCCQSLNIIQNKLTEIYYNDFIKLINSVDDRGAFPSATIDIPAIEIFGSKHYYNHQVVGLYANGYLISRSEYQRDNININMKAKEILDGAYSLDHLTYRIQQNHNSEYPKDYGLWPEKIYLRVNSLAKIYDRDTNRKPAMYVIKNDYIQNIKETLSKDSQTKGQYRIKLDFMRNETNLQEKRVDKKREEERKESIQRLHEHFHIIQLIHSRYRSISKIDIHGHADQTPLSSNADIINETISKDRALWVKTYILDHFMALQNFNINENSITTIAHGDKYNKKSVEIEIHFNMQEM